jgi:hypothetical protein
MSEPGLVDITGRLRSPAATPGHWAGCAPPNKGLRYPADPPTVEEIILVMRQAGPGPYGDRTRGLIAILWRAGLRISEALALTETDLDPKTGSVLVRCGKGGMRRMVGMDDWAWEHVARWTRAPDPAARRSAVLHPRRPHARARMVSDRRTRRAPAARRAGRGAAAVRAPPATARPRRRDGARRDPAADYPEAARACTPGNHVDLPPRNRYTRDRRHGPPPPTACDPSERRPTAITKTTRGARGRRIARPLHRRTPGPRPRRGRALPMLSDTSSLRAERLASAGSGCVVPAGCEPDGVVGTHLQRHGTDFVRGALNRRQGAVDHSGPVRGAARSETAARLLLPWRGERRLLSHRVVEQR